MKKLDINSKEDEEEVKLPTRSRLKRKSPSPSPSPKANSRPKRGQPQPKQPAAEQMEVEGGDCLDGLSFVVSGIFANVTRDKVEEIIRSNGGRLVGSVSGKTDYLVMGFKLEDGREPHQGRKNQEATKRGVPILDEEGFEQLLQEKMGDPDFRLSVREKLLKEISELPKKEPVKQQAQEGEATFETNMWTDLYKPQKIGDLVGNSGVID